MAINIGGGINIGGSIYIDGGAAAPSNIVLPVITGTARIGQTLSVSNGTWANYPTSYTYQWQHGTTDISGATSSTYTLTTYVGETIRCVVSASGTGGVGTATTANTAQVSVIPTSGLVLHMDPTSAASGYGSTYSITDISPANTGSHSWNGSPQPTFNYANNGYWQVSSDSNHYINVGAYQVANPWSSITLAAWVLIGNTGATKTLIAKENLYKLRVSGATPQVLLSNGSGWTINSSFPGAPSLTTSTWALITVTAGASGVVGYVNNNSYTISGTSFTLGTGAGGQAGVDFNIGAYAYNNNANHSEFYSGGLGPVMTWNRQLSASEVTEVYDGYKANYGLS